jgi:polyisoprenyl-phosphate glycosyltransferase
MSARPAPRLSVVVPVLNEVECLRALHARVAAVCPTPFELIFVDDGSRDGSFALIEQLASTDARVRGLQLSRNFGQQVAQLVGMRAARGEAVCALDADLQYPPERLRDMVQAWRSGFDVVEMVRSVRRESVARTVVRSGFYAAFNAVSPTAIDDLSSDFFLLDRACVDELRGWPGDPMRAMVARLDAPRCMLRFEVAPRYAGRTSYDPLHLGRAAVQAMVSSLRGRITPPALARAPEAIGAIGQGLE